MTSPGDYTLEDRSGARDVLAKLQALRRAVRLYPLGHPTLALAVDELEHSARRAHQARPGMFRLAFANGEVSEDDRLLTEDSLIFDQMLRDLDDAGIGMISFAPGFSRAELDRAVPILSADRASVDAEGGISAMVEAADLQDISVGEAVVFEKVALPSTDLQGVREAYDAALALLRGLGGEGERPPDEHVGSTVRLLVEQVLGNRAALVQLAALRSFDEYTYYHSANVAVLSLALGSAISREPRFLGALGTGALLHDIGKLAMPRELLEKPGAYGPEEWERMREHTVDGAFVASAMQGVDRAAIVPIIEHHMRYDCTGYPQRYPRRPMHLNSRIVAVADSYDAMTSRRSYSPAKEADLAMESLIQAAGTSLDPVLVNLFVRVMGIYPPMTLVQLSSGELAFVVRAHDRNPTTPIVRVIANGDGARIEPHDVDLSAPDSPTVAACLDAYAMGVDLEEYL